MKKAIVFLCFFGGAACFISAGLYINKNNAGMINTTQESVQKVKSPELLSDINMTQYVSLPASICLFQSNGKENLFIIPY